jgi:hypothetical protein
MAARPARNDIRDAATQFAFEWQGETRERGEAQTFWTDFLGVFGINRRRVNAAFERFVRGPHGERGFIDLLWPGMVLVEHKSLGEDLEDAMDQALAYVDGLEDEALPRLIVICDFDTFVVLDIADDERQRATFKLAELPREIDRFLFLAGYSTRRFAEEATINVKAAELLGQLYDALDANGYRDHELRVFLVRVLFLLFGDDAGLWAKKLFADLIINRTREDGSDLGMWIERLFEVLNTPEPRRRSALDEDLAQFPYVNGGLFEERIATPDTNRAMRDSLLKACVFDWSEISPAIFGAMFQSVMDHAARHTLGAHYTSEQNILKVIEPLFLDDLRAELDDCGVSPQRLRNFHAKLGTPTYFDPACGCGNFLVIAYRELRRLELEVLRRLHSREHVQLTMDLASMRKVTPSQFFGIEYLEFPSRIAETAIYLMDHLENEELGRAFGLNVVDLPLTTTASIHTGNALQMDWNDVLSADRASYVFGNPPFVAKGDRNGEQVQDMDHVFGRSTVADLDYVAAWYEKAADYLQGSSAKVGFVSTNSLTQGEQVPLLWGRLLPMGADIGFGHRTFEWSSEARGRAAVHCVIVGFSMQPWRGRKQLFEYEDVRGVPIVRTVTRLNPYLVEGPDVLVAGRTTPFGALPRASFGSMPNDGGHLLLDDAEAAELRYTDPVAARYLRPMLSTREMLRDIPRWCLWLDGAPAADIRASAELRRRVSAVREYRLASKRAATRALADVPYRFGEIRQPTTRYLCVPRHTSERRKLIPMLYCEPGSVAHDSTITIPNADLVLFGLLQSAMFTAWARNIGGRLTSRVRFSVENVYNTFPFVEPSSRQRVALERAAQSVLDARAAEGGSLVNMYDPDATPESLVRAHRDLDRVVDGIYAPRRTGLTEATRTALLLDRYKSLVETGTLGASGSVERRIRRTRTTN